MAGRAQRRNRGAAAQAHEVLEKGVRAQAELLGDVAGHSRTKIAAARADEERVEVGRFDAGLLQRGGEGATGELRGLGAENGVELVGAEVEDLVEIGRSEVARRDAVIAF